MTNLQDSANRLSPLLLRRLWLWLPAGALGLLALLVALGLLAPLWNALQQDSRRLRELEDLRDQVTLMRQELQALEQRETKVKQQQAKLFNLVAGSGDLSTVLAMLDRAAKATGVQLDLYEPQAAAAETTAETTSGAPAGSPAKGAATDLQADGKPAATPVDPLEVEGLKRQALLLGARAPFPALLAFLRRLEESNVLMVQSDLNLDLKANAQPDLNKPLPLEPVQLKLAVSLYGKVPGQESAAVATKPGVAPNQTPQPAQP
jgi:type IV pilus assembly protein PilO